MKLHQNKIAVITGGGRGIGAAITKKLVDEGATCIFTYASSEEKARNILSDIQKTNPLCALFKLRVENEMEVKTVFENILEKFGRVDILVNNAGTTSDQLILRMKTEQWSRVIDVNLNGVFHCCKQVIRPMMKSKWGRILNISSVIGLMGNVGQSNYAASKGAINSFTRSLAREVASRNICVNAVAPGYIETDMTENLPENIKQSMLSLIPMNRFGKPQDVANLVSWLASEDASYMTGQVLSVDGGLLMS